MPPPWTLNSSVVVMTAAGLSNTYKFCLLFSVKHKYTRDLCKCCILQTEEAKANWFDQTVKQCQHQRRRMNVEIRRCMHGITFGVIRTFQQERVRAKKLLMKAADALVQGAATALDRVMNRKNWTRCS